MHGTGLSTPVKDTVSRVAVAVAVAVAVSRVRVHRLAAISASGRERASVPSLSVSFRVSPALAAAEGRQSTGPYHPSWRVGRKVGKAPSSDERGSPVPGRSVAYQCARPASRLLWCARLSERGVVQHWGSKSWQWHVRASVSSGVGVWSTSVAVAVAVAPAFAPAYASSDVSCANIDANTLPKLVFASKYAAQACICMQIHANTAIRFFVFAPVFARRKYKCKYVHQCGGVQTHLLMPRRAAAANRLAVMATTREERTLRAASAGEILGSRSREQVWSF